MARRVNTKFVFILSAVLIGIVGMLSAVYYLKVMRSPDELVRQGDVYRAQGDLEAALSRYSRALSKRGSDLDTIHKTLSLMETMPVKDRSQAQTFIGQIMSLKRQASEVAPTDEQLLDAFYSWQVWFAENFGDDGLYKTLYQLSAAKLETYPDNLTARKYHGIAGVRTFASETRDPERARVLEDLLAVYGKHPEDALVAHHIALWHLDDAQRLQRAEHPQEKIKEQRDKALEVSRRMLAVAPDDRQRQLYHLEVLLHPQLNAAEEARPLVEQMEAALLEKPEPDLAVRTVADALPRLDQTVVEGAGGQRTIAGLVRAERLLRTAIEKNPDTLMYRTSLGRLLAMQGQTDAAIEQFAKVWGTNKATSTYETLRAHELRHSARFQELDLKLGTIDQTADPAAREAAVTAIEKDITDLERVMGADSAAVHFLRGKLELTRRNFIPAMQHFDKAVAARLPGQQQLEAMLLSARARRQAGERGAAAEQLKRIIQMVPNLPRVRTELAELYIETGNAQEAQAQIDQVLAQSPDDPQALLLQARLLAARNDLAEALGVLNRLPEDRKDAVLPMTAQLMIRLGQKEEAEQMLRARFEQAPQDVRVLALLLPLTEGEEAQRALVARSREAGGDERNLALIESTIGQESLDRETLAQHMIEGQTDPVQKELAQAQLMRAQGDEEGARAAIEKTMAAYPDHPSVVELQFTEAARAQDWAKAAQVATRAGALNVDAAQGAFYRARLAAAQSKFEEAIAEYRRGLSVRDVYSDGWRQLGDVQVQAQNLEGAAESYRRAIEQRPDNARARRGLAIVADMRGQHELALQTLREAIRFSQDSELVAAYLSYEQEHGDAERALELRRQVAERNPKNEDNRRALAMGLAREGKHAEAIAAMEQLIADTGESIENVAAMAAIRGGAGDPAAGRALLEKYIASRGDQVEVEELVALARYDLASGDLERAMQTYAQARQKEDAESRPVTREMADILFARNLNDRAVDLYHELYEQAPDDTIVALRYAEALIRAEKIEEASQIAAKHPGSVQARLLEAAVAMQKDDRATALNRLNKALEIDPRNSVVLVQLASLLAEDPEQVGRAKDLLQQALRNDPEMHQARMALAGLHRSLGELPEAATQYRALLDRLPDNAQVRLQLLDLYTTSGDLSAAVTLLSEAARRQPQEPTWPKLLARVEAQRKNLAPAIDHAKKTLELEKSPDNVALLATLQLQAERAADAIQTLAGHQETVNAEPVLQSLRGWGLAKTGKDTEARQVFARAVERARNLPELVAISSNLSAAYGASEAIQQLGAAQVADPVLQQFALAQLELENRQFLDAIHRLDALAGQIPVDNPGVRQMHLRMLSQALHHGGNFARAAEVYRQLIALAPEDVATLNNLAYLLTENLQQPSEGLEMAERAAALAPENPQVLDTLGWAQFKAGRAADAQRTLERSIRGEELAPNHYHMAATLAALGEPARARRHAERAVELAEQTQDTQTLEQARALLNELGQAQAQQ